MTDDQYEQLRPLAFSIAYRMVGSVTEAEDLAQEAMLRFHRSDVESPRAFISAVTTRLAIDHLRSARVRRETYVGPWLPEPLLTDPAPGPGERAELADSLSQAFLVLLERLTPTERAAFLMREVFGHEYAEIGRMLARSEGSCRQLVSRARRHVDAERPRFEADTAKRQQLTARFIEAIEEGDTEGLTGLLAADAVFMSDGGGKATAARKQLHGAARVARVLVGIARSRVRLFDDVGDRAVWVNGQPGLILFENGHIGSVMALDIADGQVQAVRVMRNPEKMSHLDLA